jgi:mevalonate kinase
VCPSAVQLSFSVPGKVFLLGEYAVLAGLPAIVATVAPRFRFSSLLNAASSVAFAKSEAVFAPQSPAGRLTQWACAQGLPGLQSSFTDPYAGKGGFGASSAQFALVYQAYAQLTSCGGRWEDVWRLYRELTSDEFLPPSGADLVAQWRGGITFFDPLEVSCTDLWPIFNWSDFLIFSATGQPGRKTATHEHLKELAAQGFPSRKHSLVSELKQSLTRGIGAIRKNNQEELAHAINEYADVLWRTSLETPITHEDRLALMDESDVMAVKGAGALQSDALIVMMRPRSSLRHQVIQAAKKRGLDLISDGLPSQLGVTSGT